MSAGKESNTELDIVQLHDAITSNDLINEVELRTKTKWRVGSRSTYYSAISKARNGQNLTLIERLMIDEAISLVEELECA
jgi:hypothetical protein